MNCRDIFAFLLLIPGLCWAQDAQDAASTACASSTSIFEYTATSGYVESLGYPDTYYLSNEYCQWYINPTGGIPQGQKLYLEIEFFHLESCCDYLKAYVGRGVSGSYILSLGSTKSEGLYYLLGDEPVTLLFDTDGSVTYPGFRVYYYIGELSPGQQLAEIACDSETRPAYVTNTNATLIETINYPLSHPSSTYCEWTVIVDDSPDGLYLNVLYFHAHNYLYIYFDEDRDEIYDTYWYGSVSKGTNVYVPGSVMTLYYSGSSSYTGFQLYYYPADSACTSGSARTIDLDVKQSLGSPGYPYDVPEHLSCRWLVQAAENQKIILTSVDLDLYGDGIDCENEFVEVLDGDSANALSLGQFCGNMSFESLPSTTNALQVYFRSHETSSSSLDSHTGFLFDFEPVNI